MAMTTGLSSASSVAEKECPEEVCIVLRSQGESRRLYYIYVVDLNEKDCSDSRKSKKNWKEKGSRRIHAIRLNYDAPMAMTFAVFKSTLYMFGGSDGNLWQLETYSYSLSSHSCKSHPYDLKFSKETLNSHSSMKSRKLVPRAVLIKNQICVFSSYLSSKISNFEVYDPVADKWSTLPEPPIDYSIIPLPPSQFSQVQCCAICFYYVDELKFTIFTRSGSYCLDFDKSENDRKWVACDFPPYGSTNSQPVIRDNNLLFSPTFCVYGLNTTGPHPPFEYLNMKQHTLRTIDQSIIRLPKKDTERLRVCIFESGGFKKTACFDDSFLAFHLFQFDDDPWERSPTLLNSRLILLDGCLRTNLIRIEGIFLMQVSQSYH